MRSVGTLVLLAALAALGCGKKAEPVAPAPNEPGGTPTAPSDKDRLQGVWAAESFRVDPPGEGPPPDVAKTARYSFQGDRLSVAFQGRIRERYTVTVGADQNPKVLLLTVADDKWEPKRIMVTKNKYSDPEKHEWLFKFEGDKLVLAQTIEPGARPTDFNPRKWLPPQAGKPHLSQVAIVTLVKSTEPPPKSGP